MSSLPRLATFYIILLIALALGAVLFSAFQIGTEIALWAIVIVISIGIALIDTRPVALFGEKIEITLSGAIKFATVLLFPVPIAILGTFIGTTLGEITAKRAWFKKLFNSAQMTASIIASSLIFRALYRPEIDYFGSFQNVLAVILAGTSQFLISSILVSLIVSFVTKTPVRLVWMQNARQVVWYELALSPLGLILAILWQYSPISILLAFIMFLVLRHSSQVAVQLQRQTHDALRALMQVIDERDRHTFDHSERVSQNATMIATTLKLPPEEVEIITSAALMHDLGKVGMADDVLFNTNILNPEQKIHAKRHAEVGAMLLSKFPLFAKGADLVKHHHERYDGKGYPTGLEGTQIPIGARIISVADSYEAMIEERPYRRAMTQEAALAELIKGSGTQFDPDVVNAFIQELRSNAPTQELKARQGA
jgi:putative nucleotidyltransferase with HDIG domain